MGSNSPWRWALLVSASVSTSFNVYAKAPRTELREILWESSGIHLGIIWESSRNDLGSNSPLRWALLVSASVSTSFNVYTKAPRTEL